MKVRYLKSWSKEVDQSDFFTIGKIYQVVRLDADGFFVISDNGTRGLLLESEVEVIDDTTDIIVEDKIVQRVLSRFNERSQVGMKKYSTTLERNDLSVLEWLIHLQEELMDATLYIERLKDEYNEK